MHFIVITLISKVLHTSQSHENLLVLFACVSSSILSWGAAALTTLSKVLLGFGGQTSSGLFIGSGDESGDNSYDPSFHLEG